MIQQLPRILRNLAAYLQSDATGFCFLNGAQSHGLVQCNMVLELSHLFYLPLKSSALALAPLYLDAVLLHLDWALLHTNPVHLHLDLALLHLD